MSKRKLIILKTLPISQPELLVEDCLVWHGMKEWPEGSIAAAIVV